MRVIKTVAEFRQAWNECPKPVGLVPTMGFLHEGHMALVRKAREQNATVVVSIFVNPAQFGANEDFSAYPRDMDADLAMLEAANVDIVLAPGVSEIYPNGFSTSVDVGDIATRLEGEFRPGHFGGVATVVCKLLTIVRPDKAYFGQKDAQQCRVISRMNIDLNLGAELVFVPTVREPDGLALSSRNVNLSEAEREASLVLYRSLEFCRKMYADGIADANKIRVQMREMIEAEPLSQIDYVSIADGSDLTELETVESGALVSLAVRIGKTRLIDNIGL